ncbi:MAG: DUF2281 domain-containing protein [bacterium]
MSPKEIILLEIERVPEEVLEEILDFVKFLKQRKSLDMFGITAASESALKKDWLRPEEDKAWQHL